jgi:hypothetical protein
MDSSSQKNLHDLVLIKAEEIKMTIRNKYTFYMPLEARTHMFVTSSSQYKTQICMNGLVTMIAAIRSLLLTLCCFFQKKEVKLNSNQPHANL